MVRWIASSSATGSRYPRRSRIFADEATNAEQRCRSPQVNRSFALGQCYEFTLPIHRCGYLLRPFEFGVRWLFRYVVNLSCRVMRRVLAFTDLKFSNSIIEAWWRCLKHQWLFPHSLDSVTTVRRLVAFYVDQHNRVLPHSAFQGQTPDEMYFGTGDTVPADLQSRAAAARRTRVEANRSASCEKCPSAVRGRMAIES